MPPGTHASTHVAGCGHGVCVGHISNLGLNSGFQGGATKYFTPEWRAPPVHAISWRRAIALGEIMTSVSGLLKIGEANAACRDIGARQRGTAITYYVALVALGLGGAAIGYFAWAPDRNLGAAVGWVCGAILYALTARRFTMMLFRRRLVEKGSPLNLPLGMEIAPDTLRYDVGDVQHIAKWSCVSELFRSHGYWIFLVQASPWIAPKRFFADGDAERAFIKDALAHMNEAARARSRVAVAFAEAL